MAALAQTSDNEDACSDASTLHITTRAASVLTTEGSPSQTSGRHDALDPHISAGLACVSARHESSEPVSLAHQPSDEEGEVDLAPSLAPSKQSVPPGPGVRRSKQLTEASLVRLACLVARYGECDSRRGEQRSRLIGKWQFDVAQQIESEAAVRNPVTPLDAIMTQGAGDVPELFLGSRKSLVNATTCAAPKTGLTGVAKYSRGSRARSQHFSALSKSRLSSSRASRHGSSHLAVRPPARAGVPRQD